MPSEFVQRMVQRLLGEAEKAASAGEWDKVSDIARRVLGVDPGNADAAALIALASPGPVGRASAHVSLTGS